MMRWFRRDKKSPRAASDVQAFFDEATFTVTYVVCDPASKHCAIIDSVLDYDPKSGRISYGSADKVADYVRSGGLTVDWILETHAHADHLSAAPYLKQLLGGKIAIGEHIKDVQKIFRTVFNLEGDFVADGSQFDHLFADSDTFSVGDLEGRVMHTPGHTPACLSYLIGDCVFVGDTLFMPDYGTARCDFPGGDAAILFDSIEKLFSLPGDTKCFTCHDYKAEGRDVFTWQSTIAGQKAENIHVRDGISKDEFVNMRNKRDATLAMPVLILPSVQVNIRAGRLPPPEDNGVSYLKIPIDQL